VQDCPGCVDRHACHASGNTKHEGGVTNCIGFAFTRSPDRVREPGLNGLLQLAGFRDAVRAQSPIAFATAPKSGFFRSCTRPAVADSAATTGAGWRSRPIRSLYEEMVSGGRSDVASFAHADLNDIAVMKSGARKRAQACPSATSASMTASPEFAMTALSPGGKVRDTGGSATKSARTNWNCSGVSSITVDTVLNSDTGTHVGDRSFSHLSNTPASCA